MTFQNHLEDNRMNNPNFEPPTPPTVVDTSTASSRSHARGAFSVGVVTGFALCGLLLGGAFILLQQFSKQATNQAIAPNANQPVPTQPVTGQPAPTAASLPPTVPGAAPAGQPTSASVAVSPVPTTGAFQSQGSVGNTTFTVQLLELKRTSGDMLLLRLAITNTGNEDISPGYDFTKEGSWDMNIDAISGVYVVDTNAQRKYEVLRDESKRALASVIQPNLKPGETREIYAQFPAPPISTQRLTVYFPKTSSPMIDVPITQ
jgi:hypothetical protein